MGFDVPSPSGARLLSKLGFAPAMLLAALLALVPVVSFAADLELKSYNGTISGIGEHSVLVLGEERAVLIDAQWALGDGQQLAEMIVESGRELTHILITHGHPDHYWGLAEILKRFPKAKVLARQAVHDEISTEFYSKWIHWQPLYGPHIPDRPTVPEVFAGESIRLEGHEIRFVDMPPAETMDATVFYIPSAKAVVTGDLVFSQTHAYFADLNNPRGWIDALEQIKAVGPIETVYPGHGPVGGIELIDAQIKYMRDYMEIAKPGVPLQQIVPQMVKLYPDYEGEVILWWTRGPGFGIFGPRSLGVPESVIATLPPELVGPRPGCSTAQLTIIDKLFDQGFSGGNLKILDEVMHEDFEFSDPAFPPGLDGLKALVTKNNTSFEGWGFKKHEVLCDGSKVTVRWTGTGRHVAPWLGEKPTGRNVELNGISVYLIENNQIVADWVVPDNLGFLMQIGVIPPLDITKK